MSTGLWIYVALLIMLAIAGAIWLCRNPDAKFVTEYTDEAVLLGQLLDEKERENPEWHRDNRKSACLSAMERGVDREILKDVYPDVYHEVFAEMHKGRDV